MADRGLMFQPWGVEAILRGRKTQTRRIVTEHNSYCGEGKVDWAKLQFNGKVTYKGKIFRKKPYTAEAWVDHGWPDEKGQHRYQYLHVPFNFEEDGQIFRIYSRIEDGDRMYVKEKWATDRIFDAMSPKQIQDTGVGTVPLWYGIADDQEDWPDQTRGRWRSAMMMPKWAARIWRRITQVRAQRPQGISKEDTIAEGVQMGMPDDYARDLTPRTPVIKYRDIWEDINGPGAWERNDWLWAYSFEEV